MPSKYYIRNFVPGYYYHVYNRGSHKAKIFLDHADYSTFLDIVSYYYKFPIGKPLYYRKLVNAKKLEVRNLENQVSQSFTIPCFCLMPNHFHLVFRQGKKSSKETSISNFMRRTMITYAMYFNDKYDHSGNIFQGRYKNVLVDSDHQLLYLTKYIHTNPLELIGKKKSLASYKYSSYKSYLDSKVYEWIDNSDILSYFSQNHSMLRYSTFVERDKYNSESVRKFLLD